MTNFERGEVLLVRFPDSNLRTFKLRPALLVQSQVVPTGLDQQIVAMITSNVQRVGPNPGVHRAGHAGGPINGATDGFRHRRGQSHHCCRLRDFERPWQVSGNAQG